MQFAHDRAVLLHLLMPDVTHVHIPYANGPAPFQEQELRDIRIHFFLTHYTLPVMSVQPVNLPVEQSGSLIVYKEMSEVLEN